VPLFFKLQVVVVCQVWEENKCCKLFPTLCVSVHLITYCL